MSERAEYDRDRENLTTSDLVGESSTQRADHDGGRSSPDDLEPLFSKDVTRDLWSRWDDIQTGFVDEPRQAVEQADRLVAESIKRLAESFAGERESLERQWDRGGDVSTEELRVALKRYRSFFSRILSI
jgi:inorganic triphosphatase YgiF